MATVTLDMPEGVTMPEGYTGLIIPYPAAFKADVMAAIAAAFGGIQDGVSSEVFAVRGLQGYVQTIYTSYLRNQAALLAQSFVSPQAWEGITLPEPEPEAT